MKAKLANYFSIVFQIGILFLFFYLGNWIHNSLSLIIPGSIIGMILLFLALSFKLVPEHWIEDGANMLLKILMLLFIPTAVGIMNYPSLFSLQGALFFLGVIISTAFSIVVTGKFVEWLTKLKEDN